VAATNPQNTYEVACAFIAGPRLPRNRASPDVLVLCLLVHIVAVPSFVRSTPHVVSSRRRCRPVSTLVPSAAARRTLPAHTPRLVRRDPLVLPASSLGLTLTGPPGLAR